MTPRSDTSLGVVIGGLVLALLAVVWGGAWLASLVSGAPAPGSNPGAWAMDAATGRWHWGAVATACALILALLLLGLVVNVVTRRRGQETDLRRRASRLPQDRKGVRRYTTAPPDHLATSPGVLVGLILPGARQTLRATWEDELIEISGTRTGKTTTRAIPAVLAAPGAAVVTSNKRDIVDATRGPRERLGTVWLFDPQHIAGGDAAWWWNPLDAITNVRSARKLAAIWATVGRAPGTDGDRLGGYFTSAAEELLATFLLAAGRGDRPVSDLYRWLADPDDDAPRLILRAVGEHMLELQAEMSQKLPAKQRAGVYATAQRYVSFLADPAVLAWVEDPDACRPQFDPVSVTLGADTLYSLSKEGEGSSAPLVTALTAAVLEAAEARAARCPGGRLPVPLLGVLDEAANVCPWRTLPDLVSHYGSRAICLLIVLQSWAQGCAAWGEPGMKKLWGASNVRIYGGGVADTEFLRSLSELVGDHEQVRRSIHNGQAGTSTGTTWQRERVLDTATLGALPKGTALVLLSGARPVVVRSSPWWEGPAAEAVRASIARYDPTATAGTR